jgi:hypothetical protein
MSIQGRGEGVRRARIPTSGYGRLSDLRGHG